MDNEKIPTMEKMNLYGGSTEKPFRVEYNVGDCQGGWAVLKDGTGQVVGCYKTEEEANKHMNELTTAPIDILGDEVRTAKSPEEIKQDRVNKEMTATSFWDGVFFPAKDGTMGSNSGTKDQDAGWQSTFNTPPQKDGMESTGYGNRSAGTNPK